MHLGIPCVVQAKKIAFARAATNPVVLLICVRRTANDSLLTGSLCMSVLVSICVFLSMRQYMRAGEPVCKRVCKCPQGGKCLFARAATTATLLTHCHTAPLPQVPGCNILPQCTTLFHPLHHILPHSPTGALSVIERLSPERRLSLSLYLSFSPRS